jgi:hypothetical protein
MADSPSLLTLQFLAWIADRPRTYADVMEAWRSNCPRNSVWEDAVIGGLVELRDGSRNAVVLTSRGETTLREQTLPQVLYGAPLASSPQTAIFRTSDEDVS